MRKTLPLLLLLGLTCSAPPRDMSLFILAGQSNISGRGALPQRQVTDRRIYLFGNDYEWKLAVEPVDDPKNQIDKVSEDVEAGYGPALAFAGALVEYDPNIKVGLIPCAKGGSSIHEWEKGSALYDSCLKRVRLASRHGRVKGLLFFQGETDALTKHDGTLYPQEWGARFSQIIEGYREDLEDKTLPVVYAQIGTTQAPEEFINWDLVKTEQAKVQIPHSKMIKTDDLVLKDSVHFTTFGYQTIGRRMAVAYLNLGK